MRRPSVLTLPLRPNAPAARPGAEGRRSGGSLRLRILRRLIGLHPREGSFAYRGFTASGRKRARLEAAAGAFIEGYNLALEIESQPALVRRLREVEPERRGFAVEGAAMATAVADGLHVLGRRLPPFLGLVERDFTYLAHVGAGWAMARVPWHRAALADAMEPLLVWLAYDGLGFHDTFFRAARVRAGWRRVRKEYAARAYDQGIGRGLWFACGAAPAPLVAAVAGFAPERRADLWAGIALAATYAGGADDGELDALAAAAGPHRGHLVRGAAFAAEARVRGGHVPAHTEVACLRLVGRGVASAAAVVRAERDAVPAAPSDAAVPAYEAWRERVERTLASGGER